MALAQRGWSIDVRRCPRCDAPMQFKAVLTEREEVRRLLEHLYLWSHPMPLHPARGAT